MKPLIACLFFILLTSLALASNADRCTFVDYRLQTNYPARDQRQMNWCFAHAAADNLQRTEMSLVRISAADIAINYAKSNISKIMNLIMDYKRDFKGNRPDEYGMAKLASDMILSEGYCPESILPSNEWIRNSNLGNQKIEISRALTEILDLHDQMHTGLNFLFYTSSQDLPFSYIFKTSNQNDFFKIMQNSSKASVLENLRQHVCRFARVPFTKSIKTSMYYNVLNMFAVLDDSLDQGLSASIDFSAQILRNLDKQKISIGLHTVPVFGRKFDPVLNDCVYLLKNSYSEDCFTDYYDPRIKCEKGYLWVPKTALKNSSTSLVVYRN